MFISNSQMRSFFPVLIFFSDKKNMGHNEGQLIWYCRLLDIKAQPAGVKELYFKISKFLQHKKPDEMTHKTKLKKTYRDTTCVVKTLSKLTE